MLRNIVIKIYIVKVKSKIQNGSYATYSFERRSLTAMGCDQSFPWCPVWSTQTFNCEKVRKKDT
jgi:hypothetical protein